MFSDLSQTYRRVAREFVFCHGQEQSVGIGLQAWKPWLEPMYNGSGTWLNRNNVSLAEALRAFQVRKINIINSGVFHGGERRTGSKVTDATSATCLFDIYLQTWPLARPNRQDFVHVQDDSPNVQPSGHAHGQVMF